VILVTGGAGFIGRWVVKQLLEKDHNVLVLDDLSNGSEANIIEFSNSDNFRFVHGDIRDRELVNKMFKNVEVCIHAAAAINVQESIENPEKHYEVNVTGTFHILEAARKHNVKVVPIGTCMVYDLVTSRAINEKHQLNPKSPYAASKLAAEHFALSYFHAYDLPVVVVRPFNTYGPFQKRNTEGGVISIFIDSALRGKPINVFGDGTQTRDFLYVEDCADFIIKATFSERAVGEVINAGLGHDIKIKDLALLISQDAGQIQYVRHPHPQSEIPKLLCAPSKAKKLLGWEPQTTLEEGLAKTKDWIRSSK
jgi:dTDP-glucose 4,6-dehydratase